MFMTVAVALTACGGSPTAGGGSGGSGGGSSGGSSGGSTTFSESPGSTCYLYAGAGPTCTALSSSNVIARQYSDTVHYGNTFMSFALAGRPTSYTSAKLGLCFSSTYGSPINTLGALTLGRTTQAATLTTGTVSLSDLQSVTMYSTQVQVGALSANQAVSFDVTTLLNASIAAGDSYLTLRVHFATQNTDGSASNEGVEFLGMNGGASCYPTLTIQ